MKILWITNLVLPDVAGAYRLTTNVGGGWMQSSLNKLKESQKNEIAVASVYNGKQFLTNKTNGVTYYLLPLAGKSMGCYNPQLEAYWQQIKSDFNPDVIHIHGTEFPHGLAWIRACGGDATVISIQGLVSVISRHYNLKGEPLSRGLYTFRDVVKRDSIKRTSQSFKKRGVYETEMIKSVSHLIGRTEWDKSHCWAINPEATYHYGGETIRGCFYGKQWKYENCVPHTIFISNGTSPIKGLHKILQTLPLIKAHYQDVKLYVAGTDPFDIPWYRMTDYNKYIRRLIKRYDLEDSVDFVGSLNEENMCRQYLKSNVFVNCSTIENSSNALGEALLLRMPAIASFVGGTADLVDNKAEFLYRYEETEMLAEKVCRIFKSGANYIPPCIDLSKYDGDKNLQDLLDTYKTIAHGTR